jgi:hypothetical protein
MGGISLKLSAIVGGIFCIVADLIQKTEASAIRNIGLNFAEFFEVDYHFGKNTALIFVILGAFALSFIFEPETKPKAFYLGASVLALMMALIPYESASSFSNAPNSERVTIRISAQDNVKITNAELTLWNDRMNRILARTKLNNNEYTFYEDAGNYNITLHMPGFEEARKNFAIIDGQESSIEISLKRSGAPKIFEKLLR